MYTKNRYYYNYIICINNNCSCLGHYTINDKLVSDSPKIATAPFKSTTERKMMQSPVPYPGPGSYKPFENVDLQRRSKKQTGFQ